MSQDALRTLLAHQKNIYQHCDEPEMSSIERGTTLYRLLWRERFDPLLSQAATVPIDALPKDLEYAAEIERKCAERQIGIMTWDDANYPLREVQEPPPVMFIRGKLPDPLAHPYIAVVGSRKATPYGREMAERIVTDLAPFGAAIVSGLAYGIDGAAHRAALQCGIPTVAVVGCGIDYPYPEGHLDLAAAISETGAVVSEFPFGTPPLKHNFPLRNRVISGLSLAVVVVEAEKRSGSLITARWAAEQGREVFAVPGNAGRATSSGANLLIKEGAHLVENGGEIAETLGLAKKEQKNSGHHEKVNVIKLAIVDFLKGGERNIEKLSEETGLKAEELLPLITEVELGI
jgi:DNA processing protein